ncbi:hypothetical protein [Streptomyces microflavus]|uniref:hypothetical protein n=1 Tax=Streptomyces microflavus TaxID=1919 RepID=UPI003455EE22
MSTDEPAETQPDTPEHRVFSEVFAETPDTRAFESPLKYPPCDCGAPICPWRKQARAEQQSSETGVFAELRQRVSQENECRQQWRLT